MSAKKLTMPIPPMPEVRAAIMYMTSAKQALERECWNATQARDAIRSAEDFLAMARESLPPVAPVPHKVVR